MGGFVKDFGTHFRKMAVFGGAYGVDYYFPGFGTFKDKANALQHSINADMSVCFNAMENGEKLYDPTFRGYANSEVTCHPWSIGGDPKLIAQNPIAWKNSVTKKSVLIKEELRSIT